MNLDEFLADLARNATRKGNRRVAVARQVATQDARKIIGGSPVTEGSILPAAYDWINRPPPVNADDLINSHDSSIRALESLSRKTPKDYSPAERASILHEMARRGLKPDIADELHTLHEGPGGGLPSETAQGPYANYTDGQLVNLYLNPHTMPPAEHSLVRDEMQARGRQYMHEDPHVQREGLPGPLPPGLMALAGGAGLSALRGFANAKGIPTSIADARHQAMLASGLMAGTSSANDEIRSQIFALAKLLNHPMQTGQSMHDAMQADPAGALGFAAGTFLPGPHVPGMGPGAAIEGEAAGLSSRFPQWMRDLAAQGQRATATRPAPYLPGIPAEQMLERQAAAGYLPSNMPEWMKGDIYMASRRSRTAGPPPGRPMPFERPDRVLHADIHTPDDLDMGEFMPTPPTRPAPVRMNAEPVDWIPDLIELMKAKGLITPEWIQSIKDRHIKRLLP